MTLHPTVPVLPWVKPTHSSWGWWRHIRVSLRCGGELMSHVDLQRWLTDWWTSGCSLNAGEGCLLRDSALVLFMIGTEWPFLCIWQEVKQLHYFGCPLTASHKDAGTWYRHESVGFSEEFWELSLCHSVWKWDKNNVIAPFSSTLLKCPQTPRVGKRSTKPKKKTQQCVSVVNNDGI